MALMCWLVEVLECLFKAAYGGVAPGLPSFKEFEDRREEGIEFEYVFDEEDGEDEEDENDGESDEDE